MTDKLREIVQRIVEGGAQRTLYDCFPKLHLAYKKANGEVVVKETASLEFSFPDLLADESAMQALVGEKKVQICQCEIVDSLYEACGDKKPCNNTCVYRQELPAYIYHPMQALKLILTGGDAVNYLWEEMKR